MEQSRAGSVATVSSNRTRISLGINAIAFLVTTAAVVFLTWNVADEFAPVRGTMHSYEKSNLGAYPHAYPTLDWIMHPAMVGDAPNVVNVQTVCSQPAAVTAEYSKVENTNCAPEAWQLSTFCPMDESAVSAFEAGIGLAGEAETDVSKQLLVGDSKQKSAYKCGSSNEKICYATRLMKDSCKISRVGSYATMNNDLMSWSLASGHNADLLYQGAAIVLWLVSGFHLINNMYPVRQSDMENMYLMDARFTAQKNIKRALGLVAALFYILLRLVFIPSTHVENGEVYGHILPNGSYFYVLFSIFWVTTFGCNDSVFCHMKQVKTAAGEQIEIPTATAVLDENGQPVFDTTQQSKYAMKPLKSQKLDAYLPRLAPKGAFDEAVTINTFNPNVVIGMSSFDFSSAKTMLNNSCIKYELAQLFVLPLLFLATFIRYNSWELDSKVQLIFLAGFGYALFDVCRNRISYAATVFDTLHDNTSKEGGGDMAAVIDKKKTMADYARQPVNGAVSIIELLCILLQFLLFMIVWNSWLEHLGGRRKAVVVAHDAGSELHMDWSIWFFLAYAVVSAVWKLVILFTKRNGTSGTKATFNINNKNYLYTFFCLLVIVSLLNATFVREPSLFEETRNQMNKDVAKILKDESMLYSHYGKWTNAWVQM